MLAWQPVAGAKRYKVQVKSAAEFVLLTGEATTPQFPLARPLPPSEDEQDYVDWSVEALDEEGKPIAFGQARIALLTKQKATILAREEATLAADPLRRVLLLAQNNLRYDAHLAALAYQKMHPKSKAIALLLRRLDTAQK
jgi:hypothetical protein